MSQFLEKFIARHCIKELLAGGYLLGVNDGEETTLRRSGQPEEILAAMFTTDEDYLLVFNKDEVKKHFGWVRFIYGNSDFEVISDYSTNVEPLIAKTWKMVMDEDLSPIVDRAEKIETALRDFVAMATLPLYDIDKGQWQATIREAKEALTS